jgi:hypothetical protein
VVFQRMIKIQRLSPFPALVVAAPVNRSWQRRRTSAAEPRCCGAVPRVQVGIALPWRCSVARQPVRATHSVSRVRAAANWLCQSRGRSAGEVSL